MIGVSHNAEALTLGSLSNNDGNGNENVTWKLIYLYFICATSWLFHLAQLLQKWRTIQESNW